jgi:hypothetical protein
VSALIDWYEGRVFCVMSAAGGLRVLHVLSKKGEKWQFVKITFYQIK